MKLPTSIENILNENIVENARLELKKNWNPEPILHTICAFANDIDNWGGGYILIGIEEENGRPKNPISGLNLFEIDKIQKELFEKCKLIQPAYTPIVDIAKYKGKNILVVWCFGGQTRPYKCPTTLDKDFSRGYSCYIRKMSNTVKVTESEQKELYDLSTIIPFDDRMNHESEIRDLKLPLIQNYLYEIKSNLLEESEKMDFVDLCKSMRIIDGTPEYIKPLNVGLMFFNDDPQKFFPYSQIEVVDLRNGIEGDNMTEQIFKGPIDSMIKSALTYIKNSIIVEKIIKVDGQAEAIRFFNYPYEAIEEALVNAVYHRGYDIREPVEVRIMKDRIHIVSYPGPDRSISEESMKDKNIIARKYRNRRIGEFLKELKLTEGRNTGLPKIKRALRNNGSKPPLFETNSNRDYFVTTIFMHESFKEKTSDKLKASDKTSDKASDKPKTSDKTSDKASDKPKTSDKTSDKASDKASDKLKTSDKTSDKILKYLYENVHITTLKASELLGLSTQRTRVILSKMAKENVIFSEGANRNRKYKLKK